MTTTVARAIRPSVRGDDPRATSTRLLVMASLLAVGTDLTWMLHLGEVIPPPLVMAVLTVVAVIALRRDPRRLAWVLGSVAALFLAMGGRFVLAELWHPEDAMGFTWAGLSGGGRLTALLAAAVLLGTEGRGSRWLARTAAVGVVGVLVVAGAARLSLADDVRRSDDVTVVARHTAFPEKIVVATGGALFVDNADGWRHTLTVRGTDVDVDLPPNAARRVEVDLDPGTYHVECTVHGHESMTATLVVAGGAGR